MLRIISDKQLGGMWVCPERVMLSQSRQRAIALYMLLVASLNLTDRTRTDIKCIHILGRRS